MKTLRGMGVVLQRLGPEELEWVRNWRNAPHVRSQMEFQEEISPKMQQEWFAHIDNDLNWYFLFTDDAGYLENKWAGVVHIKDIDWDQKSGEAGVFTGEKEYLETPLPVKAVLLMMDFAFGELKLERLEAKMRTDVPSILKFNEQLGYRQVTGAVKTDFVRMEVEKNAHLEATARLRKHLN